MTYNVIQRNRDNYYLYEVTASWNPDLKKNIQTRKYIGKCDENGNLLPSPKNYYECIEFGRYYIFRRLLESTGVCKVLEEICGPDDARVIEGFAVMDASRECPIPTMCDYLNPFVKQAFGLTVPSSRGGFASVMLSVYSKRRDIFKSLMSEDVLVFVIDYVPVPFQMRWKFITEQGYGYVYTPEFTTYIGLDVLTGRICYYRRIYERISSASVVAMIRDDLLSLGAGRIHFVFDHKKSNAASI